MVARLTEARANRTKGCKCFDEYVCPRCTIVATAEADLADAITPDVLAAVEAVVALGEARARRSEALHQWNTGVPIRRLADAMVATSSAQDAAVDVVSAIADRLAARKGE